METAFQTSQVPSYQPLVRKELLSERDGNKRNGAGKTSTVIDLSGRNFSLKEMETKIQRHNKNSSVQFVRKELLSERDGNTNPCMKQHPRCYDVSGRNFSLKEMETTENYLT